MSKTLGNLCLAASMVVACAGLARADIDSLYGQEDGFGLPGAPAVPANGTLWETGLGGSFFTDYRNAYDLANAPNTDIWFAPGSVSWTQPTYSLVGLTPLTATLSIQIAGIADIGGPYTVLFDGTSVGAIPQNFDANAYQEILLYTFNVPVALLTGTDTVAINNTGGDGYSINFSDLYITTAVPEPTSLASLAGGALVIGLAAARRARRARRAARA